MCVYMCLHPHTRRCVHTHGHVHRHGRASARVCRWQCPGRCSPVRLLVELLAEGVDAVPVQALVQRVGGLVCGGGGEGGESLVSPRAGPGRAAPPPRAVCTGSATPISIRIRGVGEGPRPHSLIRASSASGSMAAPLGSARQRPPRPAGPAARGHRARPPPPRAPPRAP